MILFIVLVELLSALYCNSQVFLKAIPEVGKPVPTFLNQKIETIKSKTGATIKNTKTKTIEVQGILRARNIHAEIIKCTEVLANIQGCETDQMVIDGILTANNIRVNVLTIKGRASIKSLQAPYFTMEGLCYLEASRVGELNITTNKLILCGCAIHTIRVTSFKGGEPKVELKNCTIQNLIFLDKRGKVQKKDHNIKITNLENASVQ